LSASIIFNRFKKLEVSLQPALIIPHDLFISGRLTNPATAGLVFPTRISSLCTTD